MSDERLLIDQKLLDQIDKISEGKTPIDVRNSHAHHNIGMWQTSSNVANKTADSGQLITVSEQFLKDVKDRNKAYEIVIRNLESEINGLRKLVHFDKTTGAKSKLALVERGNEHMDALKISQEKRQGRSKVAPATITAIMLDLDGFKQINDTLLHSAGDDALRHVVKLLQKNLRKEDIIARVGGDEFVVLFHGSKSEAQKKMEEIRTDLTSDEHGFKFTGIVANGPFKDKEVDSIPVYLSFSYGIHQLRASDDSFVVALAEADKAAYENKKSKFERWESWKFNHSGSPVTMLQSTETG